MNGSLLRARLIYKLPVISDRRSYYILFILHTIRCEELNDEASLARKPDLPVQVAKHMLQLLVAGRQQQGLLPQNPSSTPDNLLRLSFTIHLRRL